MLRTCNYKNKIYHCKYICYHGDAHDHKEFECSSKGEFCDIAGKRIKCRPLFKKELKLLEG